MTVVILILFLFHFLLKYEISNRMYILKKKLTLMMNDKEDIFFRYEHPGCNIWIQPCQDETTERARPVDPQKKFASYDRILFFNNGKVNVL